MRFRDPKRGRGVPALDDLILTKRFGGRPKDLEDIRLLEALRKEGAWSPSCLRAPRGSRASVHSQSAS